MIETVTSKGRKAVIAFADESALIVYVKEEPVNVLYLSSAIVPRYLNKGIWVRCIQYRGMPFMTVIPGSTVYEEYVDDSNVAYPKWPEGNE